MGGDSCCWAVVAVPAGSLVVVEVRLVAAVVVVALVTLLFRSCHRRLLESETDYRDSFTRLGRSANYFIG